MIGYAVRIGPNIYNHAVIYADGQHMRSGCYFCAQVIYVGSGETAIQANFTVIQPQAGLPMWAFKHQDQSRPMPIFWNPDGTLVPGNTHVMAVGLEPEGQLNLASLPICIETLFCKKLLIMNISRPFHIDGDLIAIALFLQRTRQMDFSCQFTAVPCLRNSFALGIPFK